MSEAYPKVYLYKRIVQAKLFIDSHFGEAIELDNIADEAYFSKFHFIRLFKNIYGRTPYQYLMNVRIEKAKELLQKDNTVTDACLAVGFESITSFTALFKRYTQTTPADYQLQFKKRKEAIKVDPLHFIPNCFAQEHGWTEKSNFQEVA
jgi:AraC-like DNA-binding protein